MNKTVQGEGVKTQIFSDVLCESSLTSKSTKEIPFYKRNSNKIAVKKFLNKLHNNYLKKE